MVSSEIGVRFCEGDKRTTQREGQWGDGFTKQEMQVPERQKRGYWAQGWGWGCLGKSLRTGASAMANGTRMKVSEILKLNGQEWTDSAAQDGGRR